MDKSGVDHAVGSRGATAKAFEIFERTAMHIGSSGDKRLGAFIGARKSEHLMTSIDQFANNGRTDKACSAGNKNTHILFRPKQFVLQSIGTKRSLDWRAGSKSSQ